DGHPLCPGRPRARTVGRLVGLCPDPCQARRGAPLRSRHATRAASQAARRAARDHLARGGEGGEGEEEEREEEEREEEEREEEEREEEEREEEESVHQGLQVRRLRGRLGALPPSSFPTEVGRSRQVVRLRVQQRRAS